MKTKYKKHSQILGGMGKTPPMSILDNNKQELDINLCIDWISCSFDFYQYSYKNAPSNSYEYNFYKKGEKKLKQLFEILTFTDSSEIQYDDKPKNFYRGGSYTLGEHIKIFLNGPVSNINGLPTNFLDMSGQACRDFENRGGNYKELFEFLFYEQGQFTRVDSAIDVFNNNYFSMDKIGRYIKNGWYSSTSGKGQYIRSWEDHGITTVGESYYFGSFNSNTLILIYDKMLERFNAGFDTFSEAWYRIEMRFKEDRAKWFVTNFLNHVSNDHDFSFIQEALYKQLKFKVPVKFNKNGKLFKTKQQERKFWNDAKWWMRLLDVSKEATFNKREDIPLSIEKNKSYINRSASRIIARLFYTDADSFFEDIMQLVALGYEKLDTVDFTAINKYRRKNNMSELKAEDIKTITNRLESMLKALSGELENE